MAAPDAFTDLIQRIRAGDEQAAVELVRQYEPFIRREVRFRLHDSRLSRLSDSMDVSQSVLRSFFVRAAAGEYDLDQPDDLLRLLVGMARNTLADEVRKQGRQRRDHRRATGDSAGLGQVADRQPTASQVFAGKELLEQVRRRLSDEESRLVDLRGHGHDWDAIAVAVGGTAQARRMQLTRALDRVARELGLDEGADE